MVHSPDRLRNAHANEDSSPSEELEQEEQEEEHDVRAEAEEAGLQAADFTRDLHDGVQHTVRSPDGMRDAHADDVSSPSEEPEQEEQEEEHDVRSEAEEAGFQAADFTRDVHDGVQHTVRSPDGMRDAHTDGVSSPSEGHEQEEQEEKHDERAATIPAATGPCGLHPDCALEAYHDGNCFSATGSFLEEAEFSGELQWSNGGGVHAVDTSTSTGIATVKELCSMGTINNNTSVWIEELSDRYGGIYKESVLLGTNKKALLWFLRRLAAWQPPVSCCVRQTRTI